MMDAFASIISNNLNSVMKGLAAHHDHHRPVPAAVADILWNERPLPGRGPSAWRS